MLRIEVSNEELVTVREAMRGLNQMVDDLEAGKLEKVVLCTGKKMRAVVVPLSTYFELEEDAMQFRAQDDR